MLGSKYEQFPNPLEVNIYVPTGVFRFHGAEGLQNFSRAQNTADENPRNMY